MNQPYICKGAHNQNGHRSIIVYLVLLLGLLSEVFSATCRPLVSRVEATTFPVRVARCRLWSGCTARMRKMVCGRLTLLSLLVIAIFEVFIVCIAIVLGKCSPFPLLKLFPQILFGLVSFLRGLSCLCVLIFSLFLIHFE